MWAWHGLDGWGWIGMMVMMAVVWLPVILVFAWLVTRASTGRGPVGDGGSDARELARRAYARGDFDRERYLQVIEDLDRTDTGQKRS